MPPSAPGRVILRDGSVASVRPTVAADEDAIRRFFHDLSPESRRQRVFTPGGAPGGLVHAFCDSSDAQRSMTLAAWRQVADGLRVVAVASYIAVSPTTAEVAFAVDDRFQGKGLGTVLLEHLAALAADHGFRWFEATTLSENAAMLDVFRDSGFEVRAMSDRGVVSVRLAVTPSETGALAIDERNRVATVASLRPLVAPRGIAVVGASRDPASIGRRVFDALVGGGFRGPIHPVNPNAGDIGGRTCYPSARALPQEVDLAVITVPPSAVAGAVDDCAAAGVKALIVVTAGFAETGAAGRTLQQQLVERARGYGLRMVGPNCMGVLNTDPEVRMNASFSECVPPHGRIALASQSGGLGLALLQLASARGIGISTFVSLGNKADVSGNDLLQYGESDPGTSVILLYLESFGNPRRFAQLARRIGRTKPIVAVKAGRTPAGSRAAGSHTAGLASSDAAVDALFIQSGVIRAETIDEMFDIAACLDLQPLPGGRRTTIVTNAGGPGIMAADACEALGLKVIEPAPSTRAALAAFLPAASSAGNPIDLVASAGPDEYRRTIETVLTADETDALVVIYTPIEQNGAAAVTAAIGQGVAAARRAGATGKPVLVCTMTVAGQSHPIAADGESLPTFSFPENAARALARIAAYAEWKAAPLGLAWGFDDLHADDVQALCREIVEARGETWLTPEELTRVLNLSGLPVVPGAIARTEEEAVALAAIVGFPVALKVSSPDILHKTEAGAVMLNLANEPAVRTAYKELAGRVPSALRVGSEGGILVQPMITNAVETIVGVAADPLFGPLVAFGLGGIHVEVLRDVAFRIAPLTDRDADALMRAIRGFRLLEGHRGRPATDLLALREILLRVSLLSARVGEIVELDLNPVMVLPAGHGCRIVDARIKVGPSRRPQ
jgi:acetyl coenzyme A synthetase (ADP forming)-like protein